MLAVEQLTEHVIGQLASADLQACAVFDQRQHVFRNRLFLFAGNRVEQLDEGLVEFDDAIGFIERDHIAFDPRNLLIDLHDHQTGDIRDQRCEIGRQAKRHIAVFVGRRNLQQRHVALLRAALDHHLWPAIEEARGVFRATFVKRLARFRHRAKALEVDILLHARFDMRLGANVAAMAHLDSPARLRRVIGQRLYEMHRLGAKVAGDYVFARPDVAHGLLGAHDFRCVAFFPAHL